MVPSFIYTIIILNLTSWGIWLKILLSEKPNSNYKIAQFLILLLISICLTLSLVLYGFLYKRAPKFSDLRKIYRRALKWAIYISSAFVGILAMRAFDVINIITISIVILFYLVVLKIFINI